MHQAEEREEKEVREAMEERQYAYWLCSLPGIGSRTIGKLLEACGGSPQKIYYAPESQWAQVLNGRQLEDMKRVTAEWHLVEKYNRLSEMGITFLSQEDADYPMRLRHIPDAPYGLFYKGKLPEEQDASVAVIGARECSQYGSYVASELGKYLGGKGIQIISGMARGIDGISQEAALTAGGTSFGVLGCGVDICYPAQNRRLYDRLVARGGVLSIYPPGTQPMPQLFPPRNRIVSGLADAVVVIEARNKSGTLITVDMALEQGKEVFVVPGRITDSLSSGCNKLIKQGAGILLSPQDFWEEINILLEKKRETHGCRSGTERKMQGVQGVQGAKGLQKMQESQGAQGVKEQTRALPPELQEIYGALDFYPQSIEQILAKLPDSHDSIQVTTMLLRLCMEGFAVQLSPGHFRIKI